MINAKILKENLNKRIKFKRRGEYSYRFGVITEISGRTREFNCGSDWHSFSKIVEFEILDDEKI